MEDGLPAAVVESSDDATSDVPALVLVADDDANVRETTAEVLALGGYEVLQAEDGLEALDLLSAHPVQVLVLDVRMPRCDGMEVLRRIDPPPPVVLLMSAYESTSDMRQAAGAKVWRFLRKPLPPMTLLAAVADAVAQGSGAA
ncbi:MAG: response regulator [Acidimicrobiales bacterium]